MLSHSRFAISLAAACSVLGLVQRPGLSAETDGPVMPLQLTDPTQPEIRETQDRTYRLLEKQSHYLLTLVHPWSKNPSMKLTTESKSIEHFIRPNTATCLGFALLYRFGPYDEKLVGINRKDLLEQNIIPMMRYLAAIHVTSSQKADDDKQWGDQWQSAHWAQMLARAAWWIWDDLPDDLHRDVRKIVAHEADRFVNVIPPHQVELDTKSEENAWNSIILSMAVVLMPDDARRAEWEKTYQRWAISAYLRPADEHSSKIVDGKPISEQFTGANIHDDFTLENHNIVHPDYMGDFELNLISALDYRASGRKPLDAALHNCQGLYDNLKWFYLPDGGCVYPNGQDWDLFNNTVTWSKTHAPMAVLAQDPDALSLLKNCLTSAEKMQARHPNHAIFLDEETAYRGAQQTVSGALALQWLELQTAERIVNHPQPPLGIKRLDGAKLIVHRTPKAIHTLSWGRVVMAQCVPMQMDRVVSPHQRDGVGFISLTGVKEKLPVHLKTANVKEGADDFIADLEIEHGDAVKANLRFQSNPDGTFTMREQLVALRDCSTSKIATGLIGVLNDPFWVNESHQRRIRFDNKKATIAALSGNKLEDKKVSQISIDDVLQIKSAEPLHAQYLGAKRIERGRATDELYLNSLDGERKWKSGQVISSYEATITPSVH